MGTGSESLAQGSLLMTCEVCYQAVVVDDGKRGVNIMEVHHPRLLIRKLAVRIPSGAPRYILCWGLLSEAVRGKNLSTSASNVEIKELGTIQAPVLGSLKLGGLANCTIPRFELAG